MFSSPRIAFITTYPPRECGIATFTRDLVDAIYATRLTSPPIIIAINEPESSYDYDIKRVKFEIEQDDIESYIEAARYINKSKIDLLNVQHEFGLFGGEWGDFIVKFLEENQKPLVTTLHTVLPNPSPKAKKILNENSFHNNALIVMAKKAKEILRNDYNVEGRIEVIPHGCPDLPFDPSNKAKAGLGLKNRVILSTFGLINPGKGIEYAIEALPEIIKVEPRVLYLVIGETHPEVRKRNGESYRMKLLNLVEELGLRRHVKFHNRYLRRMELIRYLRATDIYISPHIGEEQIVSGTVTYALGVGKAIVSTPYPYAQEVLADERGLLCNFRDPASISDCIIRLLKNPDMRQKLERMAYAHSREMTWQKVGVKYVQLFKEILEGRYN